MWQALKHVGGGGESQNHYSGRLEDNGSSFLALCVCAHKEAVIERERASKGGREGNGKGGTREPRGVGAASADLGKEAEPQLCRKSCRSSPLPQSHPPHTKDVTGISPCWLALKKSNATLSPGTRGMKLWQHRTQHNTKDSWGTVKNMLGFSPPTYFYPERYPVSLTAL